MRFTLVFHSWLQVNNILVYNVSNGFSFENIISFTRIFFYIFHDSYAGLQWFRIFIFPAFYLSIVLNIHYFILLLHHMFLCSISIEKKFLFGWLYDWIVT